MMFTFAAGLKKLNRCFLEYKERITIIAPYLFQFFPSIFSFLCRTLPLFPCTREKVNRTENAQKHHAHTKPALCWRGHVARPGDINQITKSRNGHDSPYHSNEAKSVRQGLMANPFSAQIKKTDRSNRRKNRQGTPQGKVYSEQSDNVGHTNNDHQNKQKFQSFHLPSSSTPLML